MRPQPASVMCFCAARLIRNAPRRCTFITVSQSASVILKSRLSRMTPALFTSTDRRSEFVGDSRHGGRHRTRVGHVGADGEAAAPGLTDPVHRGLAGGLLEVDDGDVEPVGRQALRGGGADASCCAGDYGDPGHGLSLQTRLSRKPRNVH